MKTPQCTTKNADTAQGELVDLPPDVMRRSLSPSRGVVAIRAMVQNAMMAVSIQYSISSRNVSQCQNAMPASGNRSDAMRRTVEGCSR